MMNIVSRWSLLLCLLLVIGGDLSWQKPVFSSESEKLLFQDDFKKPPAAPWSWVREHAQTHKSGPKGLAIQLEAGSLMGGGTGVKNILVRPLPESFQTVSVEVDFHPQLQYEQAGLILYVDDDRYIKLVKEFVNGKPWIVMAVEIDAKNPLVQKVPAPEKEVRIALQWQNDKVVGMCWDQEGKEVAVASFAFPMKPKPKIGVFVQNAHAGQERWARFSQFQIAQ